MEPNHNLTIIKQISVKPWYHATALQPITDEIFWPAECSWSLVTW